MSRPPVNPADPAEEQPGGPGPGPAARPAGITVIAVVTALEATALLVAAGWYGFQLLTGAPVLSFWGAVFTLGLLLAFSAWLFAVGHFLFRGYRWPRAGALVAQLFMLTIGFPTLTGGYPLAGPGDAVAGRGCHRVAVRQARDRLRVPPGRLKPGPVAYGNA